MKTHQLRNVESTAKRQPCPTRVPAVDMKYTLQNQAFQAFDSSDELIIGSDKSLYRRYVPINT